MGPPLEESSHRALLDNELDAPPDYGFSMLLLGEHFHLLFGLTPRAHPRPRCVRSGGRRVQRAVRLRIAAASVNSGILISVPREGATTSQRLVAETLEALCR